MNEHFVIADELRKLPHSPGVYIMRGVSDEILYVGKAVDLKNRVSQYFRSSDHRSQKIAKMIALISRFEYIEVDSETEALILENHLIKENSPRYNTLLKDDKTYPFIKVSISEPFPRIIVTRKVRRDGDRYFGPYTSATAVRDTVKLLRRLFKVRSCARKLPEDIGKTRPCLYQHIGQCLGPCEGSVTKEEYGRHIARAVDFLSGKYGFVEEYLKDRMKLASDHMEYEKAIEYRELLKEINALKETQKLSTDPGADRDVIGIASLGGRAAAQVFFIRDGRMIGREIFPMSVDPDEDMESMTGAFISQYYGGTPYIPCEIFIQSETDDRKLLEKWLSEKAGRKVSIRTPKRGMKSELVELAVRNAVSHLERNIERLEREEKETLGAQAELKDILGLPKLARIESYDISDISGVYTVGSMVVFLDGAPRKSDYRKFRIRNVSGPNDYGSMREMLTRRFTRALRGNEDISPDMSFTSLPDLVLMDGGKAQVHAAEQVLSELCLRIPVCGMVKDSKHRTRGLIYQDEELLPDTHSACMRLITRIQDETHRFAIEYHRKLRSDAQLSSVLDDIKGIGPVRRKALIRYFRDISSVRAAGTDELSEVPGMNKSSAEAVYKFFHESD